MALLEKISAVITRFMSLLVVLVAAVALCVPWTFSWAVPNIPIYLGIVMLGVGMTLRWQDFLEIFKRPRDVAIGAIAQFTVMPGLAYLLAKGFGLPPELAVGVILVGACPGGTASNVMTYLARGDVALSVSMTMTTTLFAPIVTPFLVWWLAGEWIEISFVSMMISIVQVVILPIVLGILLNYFFGNLVRRILPVLPLVSISAIVLIAGGVVAVTSGKLMETGGFIMLVVVCHNLLGYLVGFALARLLHMGDAKVKAVSIEVGMQNSGLATSLAIMHFGAAAAIPSAMFSVWHNISGALMANYFSSKFGSSGLQK